MTARTLTTTLDEGRIMTCRFPRRSALTMLFWGLGQRGPRRLSIPRIVLEKVPPSSSSVHLKDESDSCSPNLLPSLSFPSLGL